VRAGRVGQRKPGEAGSPMRIGKSLTHRTGRRTQHPARGRLATGRAVGNSALQGENWSTVKPKDTATGESRESWPEGRTEEAMPGESRESRPTKSLRRDSRPCAGEQSRAE